MKPNDTFCIAPASAWLAPITFDCEPIVLICEDALQHRAFWFRIRTRSLAYTLHNCLLFSLAAFLMFAIRSFSCFSRSRLVRSISRPAFRSSLFCSFRISAFRLGEFDYYRVLWVRDSRKSQHFKLPIWWDNPHWDLIETVQIPSLPFGSGFLKKFILFGCMIGFPNQRKSKKTIPKTIRKSLKLGSNFDLSFNSFNSFAG